MILLFQAFLAFSCRDSPLFWTDFLSSFRVISVSYQRQTPRAAVCKSYEGFLPPLESWSSESPSDFLSLESALCILQLLLQICDQLHLGQHHQVLPPQLPHSWCSHFTILSGVLHLFPPVCSSVNFCMRWWESSDFCDFQWWHEQF